MTVVCGAVFHLAAADITWGEARNITGDSDVYTNGVLRYAYANADATVNGVKFSYGMGKTNFPVGEKNFADITLGNVTSCYHDKDYYATKIPDGACEDYLQLLKGAVFSQSSEGGSVTSTFTLNNLVPGHEYIVQIWTHDRRQNPGDRRYIKVDDSVELKLRTSSGFGQYIIGSFTADVETQSFSIVGYAYDSEMSGVSQINSIQLRDVTPGCIRWEEPKDIAADSDVRLDGEPVFAACWVGSTAIVNDVVFVPLSPTNSTTVYPDAKMTLRNMSKKNIIEFTKNIDQSLSDDYHRLLGGATYQDINEVGTVTFDGLEEGGRYLVQLWISDTRRGFGSYRQAAIDGGFHVLYKNTTNGYGQHITGLFTAISSSQNITIHPMTSDTPDKNSVQLNAIQLRRLDAGATTHWRVSPITKRVLDVRTDGVLKYAYNFGCAAITTEVNGVEFTGLAVATANGGNDDFGFVTPKFGFGSDTEFFKAKDEDTPEEYITMLKSSVYSKGGDYDVTPSTLTLKRLTPGHRYLVQIWASEQRNEDALTGRYQILDGVATMIFRNTTGVTPLRGDVATGLFTATATSQAISIQSRHWTDESTRAVQLNGMQVRDLGEAQGLSILVEDVPMWHVASGAMTDLYGATRRLGTVSGSGSITNGTVSGTLVVSDGSAITLKDITLSSGITLDGASSVTFAEDVNLAEMPITLANPASLAEMGTPIIMSTGTLSGTPKFTLGSGGYVIKLTDEGYVVKKIYGLTITVR